MIHETRKRSLVKAISFRILEVAFGTLILSSRMETSLALSYAVIIESMCMCLHYLFERGWNRVQWGRYIE